jgi:hypothetical protein
MAHVLMHDMYRSLIVEIGGGITRAVLVEHASDSSKMIKHWTFPIAFAHSLQENNYMLPRHMIEYGYAMLGSLKTMGEQEGATHFEGFVTGALISAKNIQQVTDKWGSLEFDIHIPSSRDDGELSFKTAHLSLPELPIENLIVIDSGPLNSRICARVNGDINVYSPAVGTVSATRMFIESIKKEKYSEHYKLSPMGKTHFYDLITILKSKINSPSWLQIKLLHNSSVISLGRMFFLAAELTGHHTIHLDLLKAQIELEKLYNKSATYLSSKHESQYIAHRLLPGLAHVIALMESLNIETITPLALETGTIGAFVSNKKWTRYTRIHIDNNDIN